MSASGYTPQPRADYCCTRCEAKGFCSPEQPWRDLPVAAARCPKCGAKKYLQRLYNAVNVSAGGRMNLGVVKKIDERIGAAGFDGMMARKHAVWRTRPQGGGARIVAPHQMNDAIASLTGGRLRAPGALQSGEAKPTGTGIRSLGQHFSTIGAPPPQVAPVQA